MKKIILAMMLSLTFISASLKLSTPVAGKQYNGSFIIILNSVKYKSNSYYFNMKNGNTILTFINKGFMITTSEPFTIIDKTKRAYQ